MKHEPKTLSYFERIVRHAAAYEVNARERFGMFQRVHALPYYINLVFFRSYH